MNKNPSIDTVIEALNDLMKTYDVTDETELRQLNAVNMAKRDLEHAKTLVPMEPLPDFKVTPPVSHAMPERTEKTLKDAAAND